MDSNNILQEEIILENERARLEPLTEKHFELLWPIAQHLELWEFTSSKIKAEADFKKYFDTALREKKQGSSYPFAIYDKQKKQWAGCTRFANISLPNKRLEIGFTWYHPALQRTGINKACKFLLLSLCFETMALNRVELKTGTLNLKSQGAMMKIGAIKEGVFRNHIINDDGTIRHTMYFSFIKEDWPGIKASVFTEFTSG